MHADDGLAGALLGLVEDENRVIECRDVADVCP
jgi:hypothetical protein